MRRGRILLFFSLFYTATTVAQEFYVRGEVKDSTGQPLQNVQIRQFSTGLLFKSGVWGSFGFSSRFFADTLQVSLRGYRTEKVVTAGEAPIRIVLRALPPGQRLSENSRLASRTANMNREERKGWFTGDETYADLLENKWVSTLAFPSTGLSLTVDQASYSNIRRFISRGTYVPADAVRVEEIFNYFPTTYLPPADSAVFAVSSRVSPCPWNWNNHLLHLNLSARKLNLDSLPPAHLVFLIDISASMDMPNRLPLLQSGFRMLLSNLREKDSVSIVVYGGMTAVLVRALSGCEKDSLTTVINGLVPGGATLAQLEGGEVGSGHTLTALFEIEPTEKFASVAYKKQDPDSIAWIQLQYRLPGDSVQRKEQVRIPLYYVYLEQELKQSMFMASLAQFGMLLKGSPFLNKSDWKELVKLGEQVVDSAKPDQLEWLALVRKCSELYDKKKKRNWNRLRR